jgi:two-component system, NarL family, sensor kinase
MTFSFGYLSWWIGIFYGLIFLLEILAPVEYVFGHLYIIPILLAACELSDRRVPTLKILSTTSLVTGISIFLTLFDLVIVENIHKNLLSTGELSIAILINRVNVLIVLLVSNWLIQSSLSYMEKISIQKEKIARQQAEISVQIQLDRIHKDFVYTLTHDIKTPLLGAIQTIEYFEKEKFGSINHKQSHVLMTMLRSQQLSLQLIETLLDIYQNDAEGLVLNRQPIDLRSIAREAIDLLEILGLTRQINCDLSCYNSDDLLPELSGDRLQLSRVFSNLLSNAIYHSPRGRQINVSVYYRDCQYIVRVVDRGNGIDPADLPFLFDRFYQSQQTLKGSGLGLYLSRQIVEAHGGKIWAENVIPQGAKFYFSLPTKN